MEHYSHIRMSANRAAVDCLETGLMQPRKDQPEALTDTVQ